MKHIKFYCSLLLSLSLCGCAFFGYGKSSDKTRLPKVTTATPPGGVDKNWRYLGTSDDGQLIVEINDSSITSSQPLIYNYQDRKTVAVPSKFTSYTVGQPHYKYLVGNWQMDCNTKQYIILNTNLYDESAVQLMSYNYMANSDIKWIKIGEGSLAELQYNYICLNKNRNLGY